MIPLRLPAFLLLAGLSLASARCTSALAGDDPIPPGWVAAGSALADYEVGTDRSVAHSGRASGYLRSIAKQPAGFGTLMQRVQPAEYRGRRVRLSAWVKADAVAQWAGLWMRVDGPERGESLAFDNMQNRAIRGASDFTRYEVVLDVPEEATLIAFGVLLQGTGGVWIDDVALEVVDASVPTTDMIHRALDAAKEPRNMGFEQ